MLVLVHGDDIKNVNLSDLFFPRQRNPAALSGIALELVSVYPERKNNNGEKHV